MTPQCPASHHSGLDHPCHLHCLKQWMLPFNIKSAIQAHQSHDWLGLDLRASQTAGFQTCGHFPRKEFVVGAERAWFFSKLAMLETMLWHRKATS